MTPALEAQPPSDSEAREREPLGENIAGRYRICGHLGSGGMGSVYEVEHLRLGRRFALKLLRPDWVRDRAMVERFEQEVRATAALHSQHVVSIVDAGELDDGRPYFVMERLLGQDLSRLLKQERELPVGRAVNIAIDACLGLHAAHATGLVHRDLKPENLFITTSDEGRDLCKVLDFGVAKIGSQAQTRPGALVGTARYMAPEQIALDGVVGPRADLFALCVILYQCLCGQHPFEADSLERVLYKIMTETVPSLDIVCPRVPAALSALIQRGMAREVETRPASALELAEALSAFAGERHEVSDAAAPWRLESNSDARVFSDRVTPVDSPQYSRPPVSRLRTIPVSARFRSSMLVGAALIACSLVALALVRRNAARAEPGTPPSASPRMSIEAPATPLPESPMGAGALPRKTAPMTVNAQTTPAASPTERSEPSATPTEHAKLTPARAPSRGATSPAANWFDAKNPYAR